MITKDIYSYLSSDSVLAGLLGGTSEDSCIYPDIAPKDKQAPYVIYRVNSDGTHDEILEEIKISISCFSVSNILAGEIRDRVRKLLDKQDSIEIASENYYIYWCKLIDGSSMFESDTEYFNRTMLFSLKFKSKEG